jgi:predicted metal-dependent HD superfamily phosphohydrolase
MRDKLEARWITLWDQLATSKECRVTPQILFTNLAARYSEPHRAYHTLAHLEDCFAEYDEVAHLAEDPLAIQFALWYHDSIYNPMRRDNEEMSAKLAHSTIRSVGISKSFGELVRQHILATGHTNEPLCADTRLLLDIDLGILGKSEKRFDNYEYEVRLEYSWVDEEAFRKGRSAILKGFLARPYIYYTQYFQEKYERRARTNIVRSIKRLEDL